eukprot:969421-Prymnesium_polylepis.1
MQSVPSAHSLNSAPGPPSSHSSSPDHLHASEHPKGDGGACGERTPSRAPQSAQSAPHSHSLNSAPAPL